MILRKENYKNINVELNTFFDEMSDLFSKDVSIKEASTRIKRRHIEAQVLTAINNLCPILQQHMLMMNDLLKILIKTVMKD